MCVLGSWFSYCLAFLLSWGSSVSVMSRPARFLWLWSVPVYLSPLSLPAHLLCFPSHLGCVPCVPHVPRVPASLPRALLGCAKFSFCVSVVFLCCILPLPASCAFSMPVFFFFISSILTSVWVSNLRLQLWVKKACFLFSYLPVCVFGRPLSATDKRRLVVNWCL